MLYAAMQEGSGRVTDRALTTAGMEQRLAEQAAVRGRWLFKVAFDILRDATAAEDAAPQASLKAWENRDLLRSAAALGSWLTQTVVHECMTVYRRKRTEEKVLKNRAMTLEE